jgi:hypothetical protein
MTDSGVGARHEEHDAVGADRAARAATHVLVAEEAGRPVAAPRAVLRAARPGVLARSSGRRDGHALLAVGAYVAGLTINPALVLAQAVAARAGARRAAVAYNVRAGAAAGSRGEAVGARRARLPSQPARGVLRSIRAHGTALAAARAVREAAARLRAHAGAAGAGLGRRAGKARLATRAARRAGLGRDAVSVEIAASRARRRGIRSAGIDRQSPVGPTAGRSVVRRARIGRSRAVERAFVARCVRGDRRVRGPPVRGGRRVRRSPVRRARHRRPARREQESEGHPPDHRSTMRHRAATVDGNRAGDCDGTGTRRREPAR